ncbi:DNA polymerase epsilon subunit C [Coccidioides immitis H538.4]|uniref:NCT transcriptional regulatory complex subunit A n=1 Tax=Coccidioides immitis H538.4 TaxID=396776 RepID=A0A0J8RPV3_COCIT|nr:DNA polymerase epsilon subunit C [Coccidioides immitis H538.4]
MTDQDNSYRPRSPDFSSFTGTLQQQPVADPYSHTPYAFPPQLTPQASYDASPFFNPHVPRPSVSYHPQPPFTSNFAEMAPQTRSRTLLQQQQSQLQQPTPQEPPQYQPRRQKVAQQYPQPGPQPPVQAPLEQAYPHHDTSPDSHSSSVAKPEPESSAGPSMGIEIKTKFPVARIKRIMQADEDVGKVAQVTPIAVSKALELFMISLVTKAAQQAKERSSKRVTAMHLKEAIAKDEVLDFLADIISKVPDQHTSKKDEDGSDQDEHRKKKNPVAGARKMTPMSFSMKLCLIYLVVTLDYGRCLLSA